MVHALPMWIYIDYCDGEGASLGSGSSNIVESEGDSTNPWDSMASLNTSVSLKSDAPSL